MFSVVVVVRQKALDITLADKPKPDKIQTGVCVEFSVVVRR
jgi:hypothetical protein